MQTFSPTSQQEALTLAIHRSEIVWDKLSLAGSRMMRGLSDEQGRQDKMLGSEYRLQHGEGSNDSCMLGIAIEDWLALIIALAICELGWRPHYNFKSEA